MQQVFTENQFPCKLFCIQSDQIENWKKSPLSIFKMKIQKIVWWFLPFTYEIIVTRKLDKGSRKKRANHKWKKKSFQFKIKFRRPLNARRRGVRPQWQEPFSVASLREKGLFVVNSWKFVLSVFIISLSWVIDPLTPPPVPVSLSGQFVFWPFILKH